MKREVIIIKEIIARKKTLLCRVAVILGFCIFYLSGFSWLENRHVSGIHITACALDYKIPFQEIFIIPYLLWFVYIAATVIYFLLHEDENFNALAGTLALGMTLFLVVSAIYPNGLNLRPVTFERDNIFIRLVQFVYKNDTPTNVLPSIHVFNSLAVHMSLTNCEALRDHKGVRYGSLVLTLLIIMSTMFLKQHSVIDVCCGATLALFGYLFFYPQKAGEEASGMAVERIGRNNRRKHY